MALTVPPRSAGTLPAPDRFPYPGWGPGTVTVPVADFAEARFPGVCVVTGRPATINLSWRFVTTPRWVAAFLFVPWGLLAFLVALVLTRKAATGRLPVDADVAHRLRRRRDAAWGLLATAVVIWGLALWLAAISGPQSVDVGLATALGIAGIPAFLASMVAFTLWGSLFGVRGRVIDDGFGGRWVQLRGVHPAFAVELARQIRAERSSWDGPPGLT